MEELWFSKIDTATLCRAGGNGPIHPSQLMGMAFIDLGDSVLDVGCGSCSSLETMRKIFGNDITYKGVDFSKKHIDWCKKNFDEEFDVQHALDLKEKDESWDVAWSRHVVDHLESFEDGMLELMRVARKKVICTLWVPFDDAEEHKIKPIVEREIVFPSEWTNIYSRKKAMEFLEKSGWNYEVYERIGYTGKRSDTIIVMERK